MCKENRYDPVTVYHLKMKFLCLGLCLVTALTKCKSEGIYSIQVETISVSNFHSKTGHESLSRINIGEVGFGTPEQKFKLIIDTGSSDLWVGSARCQGYTCPLQRNLYYHNRSSTYRQGSPYDTTQLSYGSGNIDIRYSKETVHVGNIQVDYQDFGEALAVNKDIIRSGIEGIMGLGFKALAHNGKTPIFDTMVNNNLVEKPMFTFCKSKRQSMRDELIIGGTNTSRYDESDVVYAPLIQALYWKIRIDSILVWDIDWACSNGCDVVVDSGTTLVRGPKGPIGRINYLIGARESQNGQYQVTCNLYELPNVDFVIGGKTFTLTPKDYVIPTGYNTCITGFAVSNVASDFIILGGTFLDGLCTIYDKANGRVGFAKLLR